MSSRETTTVTSSVRAFTQSGFTDTEYSSKIRTGSGEGRRVVTFRGEDTTTAASLGPSCSLVSQVQSTPVKSDQQVGRELCSVL